MKKRHPHDVSDIDSPGGKHVHSSYRPLQRTETVLTVNNESNFDQHLKEKSTYEFGQPIFRRNLRKTVEVKAVYHYLVLTYCNIQTKNIFYRDRIF